MQRTIEYNIKQLFPYVSIVSEEDSDNLVGVKPTLLPDQLDLKIVSQEML